MKKIFDYTCVIVFAVMCALGSFAICNIIAMDIQDAYGKCASVFAFFGLLIVFWGTFMRWLILLQK